MSRARVQAIIRDEAGNKLGGTGYEVRIYNIGSGSLATIYADLTSGAGVPNPHYPNAGVQTALNQDYAAGSNPIIVLSSSGFSLGDFITFDDGTHRSELVITGIAGTTLTLNTTLPFAYTAAATRVNGRENLGHVAAYVDRTAGDFEMTVKNLATGIEGPRELFIVGGAQLTFSLERAQAVNNANQGAVVPNTPTKVSLQTKPVMTPSNDPNARFDNTTNYRFTSGVAGLYEAAGLVPWSLGAQQGRVMAMLYKNGAEINGSRGGQRVSTNGVVVNQPTATIYIDLAINDYIELYGMHDAAANSTIAGGGNDTASLMVRQIA